jgi:protein involved in polysaccharide export with SLBB domain
MFKYRIKNILISLGLTLTFSALAQSLPPQLDPQQPPAEQKAISQGTLPQYNVAQHSDIAPFGANLFIGGYETESFDGLNEDYIVAPGDKLAVWIWGAVNLNEMVVVDSQGNIFIPEVGPIHVGDVPASLVNSVVTNKIKTVYTNNVNTYVNLLTATPVSVYVTGSVLRPGQYAGHAADSILSFLKRAGGVDGERGSYRHIKVLRENQLISEIDLYEFLLAGHLPNFNFKDGDVIIVEQQGATVTVEEGSHNIYRFEFDSNESLGDVLINYAKPFAKISHVAINGTREAEPFSVYLPYKKFKTFKLQDGDNIRFEADLRAQVLDVKVQGSYLGPSFFTVKKDTRLHQLLDNIPVNVKLTNINAIYIERKSVALKQKEMIDQSLDRLERTLFSAPASSDGEAKIRAVEAELVMKFIAEARKVQPKGRVIVSDNGKVANIQLEQDDIIIIPAKSDLVHVGGEVMMPQALVFNENASIEDYLSWAGGYTSRSDIDKIAVVHQNGIFVMNSDKPIQPGDQILIMPKVDTKWMQSIKDITQIIYQIAIAAIVIKDF